MDNVNARLDISMTSSQAMELQTLIDAELRNTGHLRQTFTLSQRRLLLKQAKKALIKATDGEADNAWKSDGTGTV